MSMKKLRLLLSLAIVILNLTCYSQDKWDLRRCVDYALANNISIKQADIQARLSRLTLSQSKLAQIPTLTVGTGVGVNSGNSLNQTTYTINNTTYLYNNYSLQANVTVFNGFYLRNLIAANRLAWQATLANSDKTKNDLSLNVANAYLQVLLTKEQSEASQLQLHLSQNQLEITRKQVKAGSLPELNAAELESQVAQDSSTYITSTGNVQQAILTLKAYMDLDASVPFEVYAPPVDDIPIEKLPDLQPEAVYSLALANQPLQKMDALQIESARSSVKATKGAMYPVVSLFGTMGSNFVTLANQQYQTGNAYFPHSIGYVSGSGTPVINDSLTYANILKSHTPYFKQLNQYFQQQVGLNVSIPILNSGILRTNFAKSKLNLRNQELQRDQDNLTLKQNIYQAYTAAITALQKFEANKITVTATQKSYDYAQKRYGVGMLNTIDLLTNQNNFFNARINLLSAQYDYVFKMKVLEFYKGLGIKLTKE
ncbi:MAG TPA: TolC family protein [Puia sp.]|nr:TolC family protein [Puia sp.]